MAPQLAPGTFFGRVDAHWHTDLVKLSVVTHDHGRRVPCHAHEHAFFSLLLSGSYRELVAGRTLEHTPLTVVYHPEHLTHSDEIGPAGARFFTLEMAPELLDGRLRRRRPLASVRDLSGGPPVWMMVRLFREASAGPAVPVSLEEQAAELVDEVAGAAGEHPRRAPSWLAGIQAVLEERYREPLTLSYLAGLAGIHPVYLSRVFRHFHGRPIRAVVHQLRVHHACRLLARSNLPLAEVALEAGFVDQSHLTHVFRRVTGMTPGAMRRLLAGHAA